MGQFDDTGLDLSGMSEEELAEMEKVLEAYAAQEEEFNPSKGFVPNGSIEELIRVVGDTKKMIYLMPAANSLGKTAAAIAVLVNIMWGPQNRWFDFPRFREWPKEWPKRFWYISEQSTLRGTVCGIDESSSVEVRKWFPKGRYRFTKSDYPYFSELSTDTGWSGSFKSFEQEVKKFASEKISVVIFDEPPPEGIFNEVMARLMFGGIVIMPMTPLYSAAWTADRLVDKADEDIWVMPPELSDIEQNCFGPNTELLTDQGWRNFDLVRVGDMAATVDLRTMALEYQGIEQVVRRRVDGQLLGIGGGLLSTGDHRMVVFDEHGGPKARKRTVDQLRTRILPASKLYRGHRMMSYVKRGLTGTRTETPFPGKITGEDWCEFMGWYLSEGCVVGTRGGKIRNYGVMICQTPGAKRDHIRRLLSRTNWDWHERKNDFYACDKELHRHLLPLGNSFTKRIPRYMFDFQPRYLEGMWQALLAGDGDGKNRYVTTSPGLADDVQELLLRLGYNTTLRKWNTSHRTCDIHPGKSYAMKDQYCVRVGEKRFWYVMERPKPQEFNGVVSCVTVPNGTIIVRDATEKYPLITGNCKEHGVRGRLEHEQIQKIISKYDDDEREARVKGTYMYLKGIVYKGLHKDVHRHILDPGDFTQDRYKIYNIVDPHTVRPDLVGWFAVDQETGLAYAVGEFPSQPEFPPFHTITNWNYKTEDVAKRIQSFEEDAGWNGDLIVRVMDPNFGRTKKGDTGMTTQQYFRSVGRKIGYRLNFTCDVNDDLMAGHRIVREYIHVEKVGEQLITHFKIGMNCPNLWHGMTHYMWLKTMGSKAEHDGQGEKVEGKHKDGPDLVRYFFMFYKGPRPKHQKEEENELPEHYALYTGKTGGGTPARDWRDPYTL